MAILLQGAAVLTVDPAGAVLPAADIRIEGGIISGIGAAGTLARDGDEVVDCADALVMPGLVNVHTHAATAFFRGLADDLPRAAWPPAYRVPGQERFVLDDFLGSARAACAEFLLNGVTTIADRLGDMDRIAPVIAASGIRAVVGQTITDRAGPADWSPTERVIERFGTDPRARVHAGLAPHAPDSCSDALLAECARRAGRLGCRVFLHVAQSRDEVAAIRARGHAGALECLRRAGLVGPHIVAAHGIYLDDDEIGAWPEAGISLAHCPSSNLKIEARTVPIHRLLGRVPVGLGTDWTASSNAMDLLAEARLAALVGKLLADDPEVLTVDQMIRMLTVQGARVLGLDHLVGSVEMGKRADLLVLGLDRLEMTPAHSHASNVVYSANPRVVRHVMVDGEWRVRDGRLTGDDEAEIARENRRRGAAPYSS